MIFKSSVGLIFVALRFNALFSRLCTVSQISRDSSDASGVIIIISSIRGCGPVHLCGARNIWQYIEDIFVPISN